MKKIILIGAAAASLLCGCKTTEERTLYARSVLNQKAPELYVEKWLTPEPDTKGKFVVLDFWATWCPTCVQEIPILNKIQKAFPTDVQVIGISDETEDKVKSFHKATIEYASAIDTQARTKNNLEIHGIPHVLVIDPNSIVRWEGFPLATHHLLTEKVVKDLIESERRKLS